MPRLAHNARGDEIPEEDSASERAMIEEKQQKARLDPIAVVQDGGAGRYDSPISSQSIKLTACAIRRRWNVPKSERRKIIDNLVVAAQSEHPAIAARAAGLLLQAEREDNLRISREQGCMAGKTIVNQQINLNGMSQKQLESLPAEELVKLLRG